MVKLQGSGNVRELQASDLKEVNGRAITDTDIESITITVYNTDLSSIVVDETAMSWDDGTGRDDGFVGYVYSWITTGVAAGTYKWFVAWTTIDGVSSWAGPERIRVAADPRAA